MKINVNKYKTLVQFIPSIQKIIHQNNLSTRQAACLELIHLYYKNKNKIQDKKNLRQELLVQRSQIPEDQLKKDSDEIYQALISSQDYQKSKIIFCYISFRNEIDTSPILKKCLEDNKILCVPIIHKKTMIPSRIESLDNLIPNSYGILEPQTIDAVNKNEIDLTLVPGLAYNPLGYRLGYGGGFYDRFLQDYPGCSIGLIRDNFIVDHFIPDFYDEPVNKLITTNGLNFN